MHTDICKGYSLILASKSPRRKMLLAEAGFTFDIVTQDTAETFPPGLPVATIPQHIATCKAEAVKPFIKRHQLIIAADTIVAFGDVILGKPKDAADAFATIKMLSGNVHQVVTGICLANQEQQHTFAVTTSVYFNELSDEQIHYYIQKYQPYDKAGAYAIQEWIGMVGVEKIDGCYFNVMGLPVSKLLHEMAAFITQYALI